MQSRSVIFPLLFIIIVACQPPLPVMPQPDLIVDLPSPTSSSTATPTSSPEVAVNRLPTLPSPTNTVIPVSPTLQPSPTIEPVTTLLFTGVIVPARCVQAAIDERGSPDYIYDEVRQIIEDADLAIGTFNATMSAYPPHTGCRSTYVLVSSPDNADAMQRAGFDVMSVATNHIKNCGLSNCGDRAFYDTLDNLHRVGIQPVGAGSNHAEAMLPVVITVNGVRFGFVSLGQIEPLAFAGDSTPGIAVLTPENLQSAIQSARQVSDVVIAMPHWGPEDVPTPNWIQRKLALQAVEYGADLVVGNHTHVVQALQEINSVPVFYGLGNFVFDQWPRDHQQGVILLVSFKGDRYVGYELIPTHVDKDGTVHVAEAEEAAEVLLRIQEASEALK